MRVATLAEVARYGRTLPNGMRLPMMGGAFPPSGGAWPGIVGSSGYVLCDWSDATLNAGPAPPTNDVASMPAGMSYASTASGSWQFLVPEASPPVKATLNAAATEGSGGQWTEGSSYTVKFMMDGSHSFYGLVSVYCLDYNGNGMAQTITDGTTLKSFSGFTAGAYAQWTESIAAGGTLTFTCAPNGGDGQVSTCAWFFDIISCVVTGVSPNRGSTAGGTPVVITGVAFTGATSVTFGGTNATSYTVVSDNVITAVAPAGSLGTVDVVVTSPAGSSATGPQDDFTYLTLGSVPGIGSTYLGQDPPGVEPFAASGGGTFTAADTSASSDSASRAAMAFARTSADTSTSSDTATRALVFARTAADTSASSDAATRAAMARARTAADTSANSDTATRLIVFARTAADTSASSDAAVQQGGKARTTADTSASSDTATRAAMLFARTSTDASSSSDTANRLVVFARTGSDTTVSSDSATRGVVFARTGSDTTASSDTATRSLRFARTGSDSSASSDSASSGNRSNVTASDTSASSDTATRLVVFSRTAADTSASSDTAGRLMVFGRTSSDTSASSDTAHKVSHVHYTGFDTSLSSDRATIPVTAVFTRICQPTFAVFVNYTSHATSVVYTSVATVDDYTTAVAVKPCGP